MNIVVLVSDAMRARNLGCYGYDKVNKRLEALGYI